MNKFQSLFSLLLLALLLSSCSSDSCTAEDWTGTWVGTITDIDGIDEETSVTIRAIGDNMISFSQDGSDYGEIEVSGCSFSESVTESSPFGEVALTLAAELSGDVITLDVDAEFLGESFNKELF